MFVIQMRQDATSQVFGMSVGRFSKVMKRRQWMPEWEAPLSGAECKRRRVTSYVPIPLQIVGKGLLTPLRFLHLIP